MANIWNQHFLPLTLASIFILTLTSTVTELVLKKIMVILVTWYNLNFSMIVILISKVPLWALLMSLVYLCKRKLTSVVKPTRQWGPGDPQVTWGGLKRMVGLVCFKQGERRKNG